MNKYDLLLLSETWLTSKDGYNLEIEGYKCEHIFGNKSRNTRKGRVSGGISVYYKSCLGDKIKVIEKTQCGILWIKLLRDLFPVNEDIFICHTYIPPPSSKVINYEETDFFEQLEHGISLYKNLGKIFITGDLNCRTSNLSDILDFDEYLDDEDDCEMSFQTSIPPRVNRDHVIDASGRRLLLFCQTVNLIIANGRLYGDCNCGDFTYCSFNGTSTVDYLLLSPNDISFLSDFRVLEFNEFSDHASLYISFKRKQIMVNQTQSKCDANIPSDRIIFDNGKAAIFRTELESNLDCSTDVVL